MPKAPLGLLPLGLLIRERGQTARTPVDDVLTAVDEVLLVEAHEDLADRPLQIFVQREARTLPVARGPDRLELLQDRRRDFPV